MLFHRLKKNPLPELLSLYPPVIGGKKATSSLSFMESSNLAVSILIETFIEEVSLKTSAEIQKVLRQNKVNFKKLRVNPKNFATKIRKYKNYICFNALHGPYGEDGQIQNILNKNKIKYTHSSAKSSNIWISRQ